MRLLILCWYASVAPHTYTANSPSKWQQMKLLRAILVLPSPFLTSFRMVCFCTSSPNDVSLFSCRICVCAEHDQWKFYANGYIWILNGVYKCHLAAFYFIASSSGNVLCDVHSVDSSMPTTDRNYRQSVKLSTMRPGKSNSRPVESLKLFSIVSIVRIYFYGNMNASESSTDAKLFVGWNLWTRPIWKRYGIMNKTFFDCYYSFFELICVWLLRNFL